MKDNASHFDTIISYDEQDAPGSDFRVQLKEELITFQAAHLENIDNALEQDYIAYAVMATWPWRNLSLGLKASLCPWTIITET
jgi:hypothetical protein